ncbi:MAG TPA: sulfide/dihydroorotate dehydrogenase-like FAD/NAD-binding protein, partial [Vicinamibacterales bacterium]|nr:sulfide/dihydroorotate dehydrogenase-like FAD/NAD-binding protein [Vicinamibacterales bacterium]
MTPILLARRLTPVTKLFVLDAPLIARSARPGQFVMLRVRDGGERIPITIADYDRDDGTVTIVVQEVGA